MFNLLQKKTVLDLQKIRAKLSVEKFDYLRKCDQNKKNVVTPPKQSSLGKQISIKEAFHKSQSSPVPSQKCKKDDSVINEKYVPNGAGENIDTMTSEPKNVKPKMLRAYTEPPEILKKNESKILVKQQTRKSYTARFRIHIYDTAVNVGLILNQIVKLWREADPSMILHEFQDSKNSETMIDHENKLPEHE